MKRTEKNIISRYLSRLLYRPAGMLDELLIPLEVNGCYLSSGCFIVAAISIDHIPPENSFSSLDDIFNLLSEHIADECLISVYQPWRRLMDR